MINPGTVIGERYEITDKVGSGGMADVYKAMDKRLNRYVAIKILKSEYSADAKFVSKFKAEAQSVAGISHPNIVNVYDVGDDDGMYYIVMELVEGITLKKFIEKKGKLDVDEAVGISIQIAQGMKAAHDNHIIHRDIKPQNIIISRDGKVKVTDFGIAKAATSNTITSNAMGSVHYISPEQARGGYSDERSDIYSLGVTMYEMFSGSVPFEGDSTVSVALSHIQNEAVPLDEIDQTIPHSVAMIVTKCMQKKPEMRYQEASELISDLKRALDEPDGDYVVIESPLDSSATRKITQEEIDEIKTNKKNPPVKEKKKDDGVDPKLERIIKICSFAAALVIIVVIILIILRVTGLWGIAKDVTGHNSSSSSSAVTEEATATPEEEQEGDVEVPDLVGKTLEKAEKKLENLDLRYSLEPRESDEDPNTVIETDPSAGEMVEKYARITIYYSEDSKGVTIPDVVDKTEADARKILQDAGLKVSGTTTESNDGIKKGNVIGTQPVVGSSVDEGSSVVLIVSEGSENDQATVPNIVGDKESVALEKLSDAGLTADKNNVTYVYSSKIPEGSVVTQSKTAGSSVARGTSISYSVSRGPETSGATSTPKENVGYKYTGSVTVSENPFTEDEDPATIKLVLSQDGKTTTVWKGTLGYDDFPKTFTITGSSENNGTVTVCKGDEVLGGSYSVEFVKSAE